MKFTSCFVALALAGLPSILGCSKEPPADVPASPKASAAAEDPLAGLSAEDRAAVLAQKICPVTGEALGSMGTPIKLTIDGRDVFICCEGCEAELRADPAKYFAILDGAAGEPAAEAADAAAPEDATADEPAADAPSGG